MESHLGLCIPIVTLVSAKVELKIYLLRIWIKGLTTKHCMTLFPHLVTSSHVRKPLMHLECKTAMRSLGFGHLPKQHAAASLGISKRAILPISTYISKRKKEIFHKARLPYKLKRDFLFQRGEDFWLEKEKEEILF